jgi:hypothetical protein
MRGLVCLAAAICGVVSLSPVISMARPRYSSGFAKASAANAPMSSMAMSCMTRSSCQGTLSEPFWKNRAGLMKSSISPAGAGSSRGHPRRGCAPRSATCRWAPSRAPRRTGSGFRRRRPTSTRGAACPRPWRRPRCSCPGRPRCRWRTGRCRRRTRHAPPCRRRRGRLGRRGRVRHRRRRAWRPPGCVAADEGAYVPAVGEQVTGGGGALVPGGAGHGDGLAVNVHGVSPLGADRWGC